MIAGAQQPETQFIPAWSVTVLVLILVGVLVWWALSLLAVSDDEVDRIIEDALDPEGAYNWAEDDGAFPDPVTEHNFIGWTDERCCLWVGRTQCGRPRSEHVPMKGP